MFIGLPNPNAIMPLEKMRITVLDPDSVTAWPNPIDVLYNPQSYVQSRTVNYAQRQLLGADAPIVQFISGSGEMLSFELFFDSLSAGSEVGGTVIDRLKFAANSLLPSKANLVDVRDYTDHIFRLMLSSETVHRPPRLKVQWASLQFVGFLASCEQNFLKFDENGVPVRAMLKCQFIEHVDLLKLRATRPFGSPDTTKFRTVRQGDSLWAMAAKEYGEAGMWREVARANGLSNPRKLRAGDTLVLPAVTD